MEFNAEHANIVLKRVYDCQDPSEQIVLISGKDKKRIPIHRVILNAASKYFTGLMGPNFKEDKPKEFAFLDDSDGETIKTVVDFCYSGNIQFTEENVEKCLKIASSVEIDLLQVKCQQFYATKLSVVNSVNTLMVADKYRFVDLRQRAFQLICENFETVPPADIPKLSHPLVQELLKFDKIYEYGDLVAKHLLEWLQSDEDERAVHMPELLKLIRLEKLTAEFLDDTLESVFKRFKCLDLLFAEYKRRVLSQRVNKPVLRSDESEVVHRAHSVLNVFVEYKGENGAKNSSVIVEKFNNQVKSFEDVTEIPMGKRAHFGVVQCKNKIFVLGGYEYVSYSKSVSSYDLSSGKEEMLPGMKFARACFASVVLGKYIYVFGGFIDVDDCPEYLNSCERFDTENKKWETLKSMNVARHSASVSVLNGYIYIAGGVADRGYTGSVEFYDPKTDEWTKVMPMSLPRTKFALAETSGFLYAMGYDKFIERFDPYRNWWSKIGSFYGSSLITSAINIDGQLFAIKRTGEYGRVEIDESGNCSFIPLCKSKYGSSVAIHSWTLIKDAIKDNH